MIKFFRHIRKSLLMENKTSKYFKYAIGEIFLVVIGILIALQINNWNENRKSNQFQTKILKEIKTSIQLDLERNQSILEERILPKRKGIENLIKNMHSNEKAHDSIIRKNFNDASTGILFTYDKGAYESLKAIGLDKITNDSLRNRLIRFYENRLPRGKELIKEYNETYTQRVKLREKVLELSYVNGKTWYVRARLNTKDLKSNKDLLKLLDIEGDIYWNNYRVIVPIIKEAEDIISLIDKTI
ncbi:DUF6090 family protein [Hanstruepera ponticola]|uniref:DUF6090 family protein n=1 Tax=Hanstruepera ponticola TaxID=2042995 RepID=UPI001781DE5B|nr:DUF6090 family protein [Hanstruepera ponticola]